MPRWPGVIGVYEGVGDLPSSVVVCFIQFTKSIAKSRLRLVGNVFRSPFGVIAKGFVSQSETQR